MKPGDAAPYAVELLRQLRETAQAQLEAWAAFGKPVHPKRLQAGLRPLLMRWTLEQQLLFPALCDAFGGDHAPLEHDDRELATLRGLVDSLKSAAPDQQIMLLAVLGGIAELHAESVDHLVARTREAGLDVDWDGLSHSMHDMARRWTLEIEQTGDIEDEDGDPVGLPPR